MKKLLAPHLAGNWKSRLDILERWQPKLALILSPSYDDVKLLKDTVPGIQVVGRFYHDDSWYSTNISNDPIKFAAQVHEEIIANPAHKILDYVQTNNETNQDWEGIQKLNQYSFAWMYLADKDQAYKCAIMSFSVGNPDMPYKPNDPAGFDGRMLYWQQVLPSLLYAQEHNHILNLHAYGYKTMFDPVEDWYIYRYEKQVVDNLKSLGIDKLKYFYGETGIDGLITKLKKGYVSTTTPEDYVNNQLLKWENDQQVMDNLVGGCVFTFGDSGGWSDYDLLATNAAELIANHYYNNTDYNGETPDMTKKKIYIPQIENNTPTNTPSPNLDWDENLTKRGVVLHPYPAKEGEIYWKCIKGEYLTEKEHIFVNTLDETGKQVAGINVKFYWDDGDTVKVTEDKSKDPYAYGMVDFDMHAHGNSYGTKVVSDPSDDIWGMGLGSVEKPDWNIHVSYRFTFQKVKASQSVPTTPTVPTIPPETPNSGDSSPSFTPFKGRVLASVLNVRSKPEMGDNVVSQLGNGAVVDVLEHTKDGWYKIGENQYVSDQWVEAYNSETEVIDAIVDGFARMYGIDPKLAKAVFNVESNGKAFGPDGKPIIRFENSVFFDKFKNPDLYYKYFKTGSNPGDDSWRPDENSEFVKFHGNQDLEWKIFEFAKKLNQDAAENSISIGMGQIMGFNHDDIGYTTAGRMIDAFGQNSLTGIIAQTIAFFAYCKNRQLIDELQRKDFDNFALGYNGAISYSKLLQDAYNKLNKVN